MNGNNLQSVYGEVLAAIERNELTFPVFPEVAHRVRALINDPDVSAQEIVSAISGDVAISAHLIKVANSAAFSNLPKVENLRQAISRLGYMQIHNLVLHVTLGQLISPRDPIISRYLSNYWSNNREVAAHCFVLAKTHSKLDPDRAMLAGLLHNIGAVPLCLYLDTPEFKLDAEELYELIEKLHVQTGVQMLRTWNFPDSMIEIIAGNETIDEYAPCYSDLIKVAILLTHPAGKEIDCSEVKPAKRLGLDSEVCLNFEVRFAAQLAHARSLLGIEPKQQTQETSTAMPPPKRISRPAPQVSTPKPGLLAAILRLFGIH